MYETTSPLNLLVLQMKANISKSQIEVWEAKEQLQNEIKDMDMTTGIHYLLQKASTVRKELEASGELKVSRSLKAQSA